MGSPPVRAADSCAALPAPGSRRKRDPSPLAARWWRACGWLTWCVGAGSLRDTSLVSSEVLIDADWIAAHLDDPDVRVVEVDVSSAAYDRGHIPGAILWNAYKDLRHPDYTPIDEDGLDG